MDHDGHADLLVAQPMNDGSSHPRVVLYRGTPLGLEAAPSWSFADVDSDGIGSSMDGVGDVNGDGYDDVVIGDPVISANGADSTFVYLFLGSASGLSTSPSWLKALSSSSGSSLSFEVRGLGDLDHDGFADFVVTNPYPAYQVLVFRGSASGPSATPSQTLSPFAPTNIIRLATADFDQDGWTDLVIGYPSVVDLHGVGSLDLFRGGPSLLSATSSWHVEGGFPSPGTMGSRLTDAGDLNGDGFPDLATIGGPLWVFLGNGDGLDRRPHLGVGGGGGSPGLFAPLDPTGPPVTIHALGRTPAGRGAVRMEYEIKPLATPFDGNGHGFTAWTNTGAPVPGAGSSAMLSQEINSLGSGVAYHWRLRLVGQSLLFPRSQWFTTVSVSPSQTSFYSEPAPTAVGGPAAASPEIVFAAPIPNPTSARTRLEFTLADRGRVELSVFDVRGRRIASLVNGVLPSGRHTFLWSGRDARGGTLAAGVYFARLVARGTQRVQRVTIVR